MLMNATKTCHHLVILLVTVLLLTATLPAFAQPSSTCNRPLNHPLLAVIENGYGLTFDDIAQWYCQGITLTGIIQVLQFAELTGEDYAYYLNLLASGGWLPIMQASDVKISQIAPGKGISGAR
jgi:hypothetical protein